MKQNLSHFKVFKQSIPLLLMVVPGAIWVFVVNYLPMGGLIIAFKRLRFNSGGFIQSVIHSDWVGLRNFRFLFLSSDAWVITRNTLAYNVTFIIVGTLSALLIAILLSYLIRPTLRSAFQTMILFPNFISWVVVSYFSLAFLHPSNGVLNHILGGLGIPQIEWYSSTKPWPWLLITINTWKNVGFAASLYLASILSIDKSLYEAARIDGAKPLQEMIYITLPFLKRLLIVLTLLAIGKIFYADFGLFYQIPRNLGTLYPVTDVIDTYVYRSLIVTGDLTMGVAAGLYQSVVGFILILASNSLVKRFDEGSGIF